MSSHTVGVGRMSSSATERTASGKSRVMRWAVRAPRSWATTSKLSWPRWRITATMSAAMARKLNSSLCAVEFP